MATVNGITSFMDGIIPKKVKAVSMNNLCRKTAFFHMLNKHIQEIIIFPVVLHQATHYSNTSYIMSKGSCLKKKKKKKHAA